MLENTSSYTQIYEAFEEQARHLTALVNEGGIAWGRGWFEATDGSDIFCEITAFETDIFFQIGPVLYPDGSLETNELIQVESMEKAARLLYQGLNWREEDIEF